MQAAAAAGLLDTARISGGGGNADDDDVETTSTLLNLKDVVSWAPVRVPVRGVACDHLQCCDLVSYLLLHQRPSLKRWLCPVCNKVRVLACVRGTPVAFPFMAVQVVEHSHRATHTHTHAPPLTLNSSPSHCLLCAALPCAAAADTLSLRRLLHARRAVSHRRRSATLRRTTACHRVARRRRLHRHRRRGRGRGVGLGKGSCEPRRLVGGGGGVRGAAAGWWRQW
jgi:hypothetical protein